VNKIFKKLNIKKIDYQNLDSKMQENYNFQKASAVLADYGFVTNLLNYDWKHADFLAQHKSGEWFKIQLKGRLTFNPKYMGNELYIMFQDKNINEAPWYLYPHDEFMNYVKEIKPGSAGALKGFDTKSVSTEYRKWLEDYKI
jgi:hypothetical protein